MKKNKMTLCPACNSSRVKARTTQQKMWARAKSRAQTKGLEFDLVVEDIVIPTHCPIMGVALEVHKGKSGAYKSSPSLDRIDNSKGYTKDNVWVISQLANAMKGSATPSEMETFALWVLTRSENE
jgi:hypothetical protein